MIAITACIGIHRYMAEIFTSLDALRFWHAVTQRTLSNIPFDLSQRQTALLLTVYLSAPPHTVRNLAERVGISKPAVCRALDALSRLDLVRRKKDEADRRNVFVQRTIAGAVFLRDFGDLIVSEGEAMSLMTRANEPDAA
jgi:DNA-binding MarR family transcriptional regulator